MNNLSSGNTFPPTNEQEYRTQFNELVNTGLMNGFAVKNGNLVKAGVVDTMLLNAKSIFGRNADSDAVAEKFLEFIRTGKEHKWLNYQDVGPITDLASRILWPSEVETSGFVQLIGEIGQELPKEELVAEMSTIIKNNDVKKFQQLVKTTPEIVKQMLAAQDERGRTPFHQAIRSDRADLLEMMVIQEPELFKSSFLKTDDQGNTLAHQTANDILKLLLKYAPEEFNRALIVQNNRGNTPLHILADQDVTLLADHLKTLEGMSNYPASMKLITEDGHNFLSLMRLHRHKNYKKITSGLKKDTVVKDAAKEVLRISAVGHAFDLSGTSPMQYRVTKETIGKISLEGSYAQQWFHMMGKDFKRFNEVHPGEFNEHQLKIFEEAFDWGANYKFYSYDKKIERIRQGLPTIINTGNIAHSVTLLIWGNRFIICDRGGSREKPFEVFHFDPQTLDAGSLAALEHFGKNGKEEDYHKLFFVDLPEAFNFSETILDQQLGIGNPLPMQTVGNCSFTSPVTALYALLLLEGVREQGLDEGKPDESVLDLQKAETTRSFHTWLGFQQLMILERLIEPLKTGSAAFEPDHRLIREALRKAYLLPLDAVENKKLQELTETYLNTLKTEEQLEVRTDLKFREFQSRVSSKE